jgi:hypothetical protein
MAGVSADAITFSRSRTPGAPNVHNATRPAIARPSYGLRIGDPTSDHATLSDRWHTEQRGGGGDAGLRARTRRSSRLGCVA